MTVQTDVDAEFAAYYSSLKSAQDTYFGIHGSYFQGLKTHATIPADGIAAAPNQLASQPSDQSADWNDFGFTPGASTKHCLECEKLQTASGFAWRASTYVYVAGALQKRTYHIASNGTKTDGDWGREPEDTPSPVTFTNYKITPVNGDSERLMISGSSITDPDSVTMLAWILFSPTDATIRELFADWDTAGDAVFRAWFASQKFNVHVSSDGDTSAGSTRRLVTTANMTTSGSTWRLLGFSWDGTASTAANALKIWNNGSSEAGTATGSAPLPYVFNSLDLSSENGFEIGAGWTSSSSYCNIGIWNKAMTSAEITELYNQGRNFDYRTNYGNYLAKNNLIHYWGFTSADSLDTTVSDTGTPDINDLVGSATLKNYPSATWAGDEITLA